MELEQQEKQSNVGKGFKCGDSLGPKLGNLREIHKYWLVVQSMKLSCAEVVNGGLMGKM